MELADCIALAWSVKKQLKGEDTLEPTQKEALKILQHTTNTIGGYDWATGQEAIKLLENELNEKSKLYNKDKT